MNNAERSIVVMWQKVEALAHNSGLEVTTNDRAFKVCVRGQPRFSSDDLTEILLFLKGAAFYKESGL